MLQMGLSSQKKSRTILDKASKRRAQEVMSDNVAKYVIMAFGACGRMAEHRLWSNAVV
jgi:hypothetical protein